MQFDAPGSAEYVPVAHFVMMLVPLHAEPAGHSAQFVRVTLVPPDVYEPAEHTEQLSASFSLHMLSAPQSSHPLWLARR